MSDSESRVPGFDPHKCHRVVSLSKTRELPTVLVKPRKCWLRPDLTEKLLTGTLSLSTNKIKKTKNIDCSKPKINEILKDFKWLVKNNFTMCAQDSLKLYLKVFYASPLLQLTALKGPLVLTHDLFINIDFPPHLQLTALKQPLSVTHVLSINIDFSPHLQLTALKQPQLGFINIDFSPPFAADSFETTPGSDS